MTSFEPEDDFSNIKTKCDYLNSHKIDLNIKSRFCSFISRVDYFGDRLFFYDQINSVGHVDCDGDFCTTMMILSRDIKITSVNF